MQHLVCNLTFSAGCAGLAVKRGTPRWHFATSALSGLKLRVAGAAKVAKTFGDTGIAETLGEFRYPKTEL
jgi:hypothetical protein